MLRCSLRMDLKSMSVNIMLNLTGAWLEQTPENKFLLTINEAGPVGAACLYKMSNAHTRLLDVDIRRRAAEAELAALIEELGDLDQTHDRKCRSAYKHLGGLIDGADTPEEVEEYQAIQTELFPIGMRVVSLPYIEEGGAAIALEKRISEATWAKLKEITVGKHTLADLVSAWIDAGKRLGKAAQRRAELEAALGRKGSMNAEINLHGARLEWIQAIRSLLVEIESEPKMAPLAEGVFAAVEQGIAISQRRRVAGASEFDAEAPAGEDSGEGSGEQDPDAADEAEQGNEAEQGGEAEQDGEAGQGEQGGEAVQGEPPGS